VGSVCATDVNASSLVLAVPLNAVLTPNADSVTGLSQRVVEALRAVPSEETRFIILLMYLRAAAFSSAQLVVQDQQFASARYMFGSAGADPSHRNESFWGPYLAALPQFVPSLTALNRAAITKTIPLGPWSASEAAAGGGNLPYALADLDQPTALRALQERRELVSQYNRAVRHINAVFAIPGGAADGGQEEEDAEEEEGEARGEGAATSRAVAAKAKAALLAGRLDLAAANVNHARLQCRLTALRLLELHAGLGARVAAAKQELRAMAVAANATAAETSASVSIDPQGGEARAAGGEGLSAGATAAAASETALQYSTEAAERSMQHPAAGLPSLCRLLRGRPIRDRSLELLQEWAADPPLPSPVRHGKEHTAAMGALKGTEGLWKPDLRGEDEEESRQRLRLGPAAASVPTTAAETIDLVTGRQAGLPANPSGGGVLTNAPLDVMAGSGLPGFGVSHTSLQSFAWASAIAASRALSLRGRRFLVPGADMANYAPRAAGDAAWDTATSEVPAHRRGRETAGGLIAGASSSDAAAERGQDFADFHGVAPWSRLADEAAGLPLPGGASQQPAVAATAATNASDLAFWVRADRPAVAGQQLVEDYGEEPNGLYALHHGFAAADNPNGCVRVPYAPADFPFGYPSPPARALAVSATAASASGDHRVQYPRRLSNDTLVAALLDSRTRWASALGFGSVASLNGSSASESLTGRDLSKLTDPQDAVEKGPPCLPLPALEAASRVSARNAAILQHVDAEQVDVNELRRLMPPLALAGQLPDTAPASLHAWLSIIAHTSGAGDVLVPAGSPGTAFCKASSGTHNSSVAAATAAAAEGSERAAVCGDCLPWALELPSEDTAPAAAGASPSQSKASLSARRKASKLRKRCMAAAQNIAAAGGAGSNHTMQAARGLIRAACALDAGLASRDQPSGQTGLPLDSQQGLACSLARRSSRVASWLRHYLAVHGFWYQMRPAPALLHAAAVPAGLEPLPASELWYTEEARGTARSYRRYLLARLASMEWWYRVRAAVFDATAALSALAEGGGGNEEARAALAAALRAAEFLIARDGESPVAHHLHRGRQATHLPADAFYLWPQPYATALTSTVAVLRRYADTLLAGGPAVPTPAPEAAEERGPLEVEALNRWVALMTPAVDAGKGAALGLPPAPAIAAAPLQGLRTGTVVLPQAGGVAAGQVHLALPAHALMDDDAAFACPLLGPVLRELQLRFGGRDGYHEMLFHLLRERFGSGPQAGGSLWGPYLRSLPSLAEVAAEKPLMWEWAYAAAAAAAKGGQAASPSLLANASRVVEHSLLRPLLAGSPLLHSLLEYRRGVEDKYTRIARGLFSRMPGMFAGGAGASTHDGSGSAGGAAAHHAFSRQQYYWATAVLDSRSIWWDGQRHLVPLLDSINCASAQLLPASAADAAVVPRVHSTVSSPALPLRVPGALALAAAAENATAGGGTASDTASDTRVRSWFAVTRAGRAFAAPGAELTEEYGQPGHTYFTYHGFTLWPNRHDCVQLRLPLTAELRSGSGPVHAGSSSAAAGESGGLHGDDTWPERRARLRLAGLVLDGAYESYRAEVAAGLAGSARARRLLALPITERTRYQACVRPPAVAAGDTLEQPSEPALDGAAWLSEGVGADGAMPAAAASALQFLGLAHNASTAASVQLLGSAAKLALEAYPTTLPQDLWLLRWTESRACSGVDAPASMCAVVRSVLQSVSSDATVRDLWSSMVDAEAAVGEAPTGVFADALLRPAANTALLQLAQAEAGGALPLDVAHLAAGHAAQLLSYALSEKLMLHRIAGAALRTRL